MDSSLKNIFIRVTSTIEEAAFVINANSEYRIALVVDQDDILIGTVTDGDIRRAIIEHKPLSGTVAQIMNITPHVLHESEDRQKILNLIETEGFLQVPIVNDKGQVVAVETLHHLTKISCSDNKVIIMAGGFGTRLRPLTNDCPKPMLSLGEKPLLEHIVSDFIRYGFKNFIFSVYYLQNKIYDYFKKGEQWGINITYFTEPQPLGTAGCLKHIVDENIKEPLIIVNGDVLTKVNYKNLLNYHLVHKADITLCVRAHEIEIPYGVVTFEHINLKEIEEKPKIKNFVNAGIYIVNPEIIRKCVLTPPYHMTDLIAYYLKLNKKIVIFPIHEYWIDIGRMEDYKAVQEEYNYYV